MKKTFTLIFVLFFLTFYAQENLQIGFSINKYGQNLINYSDDVDGGPGYERDRFINFGVQIVKPLNNWLSIESGLSFAKHYVIMTSNLPPDIPETRTKTDFNLLEIPIQLKAEFFKKYAFVKTGFLVDINVKKSDYTDDFNGIGFEAGAGVNYPFDFGNIYLNPYFKVHNAIPFTEAKLKQNLLETGIKVGILFNLQ